MYILLKKKKILFINKKILFIVTFISLLFFWSLITSIVNETFDLVFISYFISAILILGASYFVIDMMRLTHKNINFEIIAKYFTVTVFLQCSLAWIMFFSPETKTSLLSLLATTKYQEELFDETGSFRLVGFGSYFFVAGMINGSALLLIAEIVKKKTKLFSFLIWMFVFLFIFATGVMMSRTTLVGFGLACLLLLYNYSKKRHGIIKILFSFIFVISILFVIYFNLPSSIKATIDLALNFGFELFVNMVNTGKVKTASTDHLFTMYHMPDNIMTYIIGDGYFSDPSNPEKYYMGTDVGFLRLILYFGLPGMIVYFLYQIYIIYYALKSNRVEHKMFFILLILFIFILNLKGFTDILYVIALFIFQRFSRFENT